MRLKREIAVKVSILFRNGSLTLVMLFGITSAQVYGTQNEGSEQEVAPRTLDVLDVGYKLPIEIVSVRNLRKRKHWVRDLELEVKNVSAKPIYEVYFNFFLPDDKGDRGVPYGMYLDYGRFELLHPSQHSSVDDKPIEPGETVILSVNERLSRGYEYHVATGNVPEQASYNVRMMVLAINFGDGTGFVNGGVPYPRDRSMESRPQRYVKCDIPLPGSCSEIPIERNQR
jgi:hypothetical protein